MSEETEKQARREALVAAKRHLSPVLLAIQGVSGLGVQGDELVVYLADGSESVRAGVAKEMGARDQGIRWRTEVTGAFRPR